VIPAAEVLRLLEEITVNVEFEKGFYPPPAPQQARLRGAQYHLEVLKIAIERLPA
jgi:hypothetical protein